MFNSLDSQEAMFTLTESAYDIIKLMVSMLGGISVVVAIILGFLIVYANNFLIRRRKREFGVYLTLGMSKHSISKILITETFIIGLISLVVGLIIGVFASQFISILIGRMFEADMSEYYFSFSKAACMKTVVCFGIMFVLVILFNTISISRYKLVDLMSANRRNEVVKLKNPILSVIVFFISVATLVYCYCSITVNYENLSSVKCLVIIALGTISTFLFFWSLSGFFLVVIQKNKKIYLKDLNVFVLRQVHNKVNTMVLSMTIICLLLFVSIGAITIGVALNKSCNEDIRMSTPADLSIRKVLDEKNNSTVVELLEEHDIDLHSIKEYVEFPQYHTSDLKMKNLLSEQMQQELMKSYPMVQWDTPTEIVKVSDYNQLATLYGEKTFSLEENEYITLCNFKTFLDLQNQYLAEQGELVISGNVYISKYDACQEMMLMLGEQRTTFNVIILPDNAVEQDENMQIASYIFAGKYIKMSEEAAKSFDQTIVALEDVRGINCNTRIHIKEASVGLAAIVVFVGLYIGITFLITSAALLALKELSETSDNKERYTLLRKLGVEDKLTHKSLFKQIGIFFFMPLLLAIVHAYFGICFMGKMLVVIMSENILKSIITSGLIYGGIYIIYFISTYYSSKRILED